MSFGSCSAHLSPPAIPGKKNGAAVFRRPGIASNEVAKKAAAVFVFNFVGRGPGSPHRAPHVLRPGMQADGDALILTRHYAEAGYFPRAVCARVRE